MGRERPWRQRQRAEVGKDYTSPIGRDVTSGGHAQCCAASVSEGHERCGTLTGGVFLVRVWRERNRCW